MRIVEGSLEGKSLVKGEWFSLGIGKDCFIKQEEESYKYKELNENVLSVDVVSDEKSSGGGVKGAAGGAVLGFLIAGPIGTVVGAGLGSQKKGSDNLTIAITFVDEDIWIIDQVTPDEIKALNGHMVKTKSYLSKIESKVTKGGAKIRYLGKPDSNFYSNQEKYTIKGRYEYSDYKDEFNNLWNKEFSKSKILTDYIDKIKSLEGKIQKESLNLFLKEFHSWIESYVEDKWCVYDQGIEVNTEVNNVSEQLLFNFYCLIKTLDSLKAKNKNSSSEDIAELEKDFETAKELEKELENKYVSANFFTKGSAKKKFEEQTKLTKKIKSKISRTKKTLKDYDENLVGWGFEDINDPLDDFNKIKELLHPKMNKKPVIVKYRNFSPDFIETVSSCYKELSISKNK